MSANRLPPWAVWLLRIIGAVLLAWLCLAVMMAAILRMTDADPADVPPAVGTRDER